jgi:hypothetical protein
LKGNRKSRFIIIVPYKIFLTFVLELDLSLMDFMLDDMHKRKIDMADEIFVINVGGYIGSSTRSEIEYATATGKAIRYLEPQL